ncbi:MAG: hypothetical protein ACR2JV_06200 [Gaiellales bacterium]
MTTDTGAHHIAPGWHRGGDWSEDGMTTTTSGGTVSAGGTGAVTATVTAPRWDGSHERDLVDYFGGYFAALAGMRSGLGGQLERARDGLGDASGGVPTADPAELANNGFDMARLRRIERALAFVGTTATCVLRARWSPPVPGEVDGMLKLGSLAGVAVLLRGRERVLATCRGARGKGADADQNRGHVEALKSEAARLVDEAQRLYLFALVMDRHIDDDDPDVAKVIEERKNAWRTIVATPAPRRPPESHMTTEHMGHGPPEVTFGDGGGA